MKIDKLRDYLNHIDLIKIKDLPNKYIFWGDNQLNDVIGYHSNECSVRLIDNYITELREQLQIAEQAKKDMTHMEVEGRR